MDNRLLEWVCLLKEEYLDHFIASGGSAVKIALADGDDSSRLIAMLTDTARRDGYLTANISAATTRIDLMQDIYFAVSRRVDWLGEADKCLRQLLEEDGMDIPADIALNDFEEIVQSNLGRLTSTADLRNIVRGLTTNSITKNYKLVKDFRVAWSRLVYAQTRPKSISEEDCDTLVGWLCGEPSRLSSLQRLEIFQKIGKHNARWMLYSLARMSTMIGYKGLLIVIDFQNLYADKSDNPDIKSYNRSRVLDFYDVLRQFIDDTAVASHLAIFCVGPRAFVQDAKKSVKDYPALQYRVIEDVRNEKHPNPLNIMVDFYAKWDAGQFPQS